ncbi:MAG: pilus assembly PilX N-terminal domain-containing protein [Deltaproteobacteria bacterium]|nr:pilus assembly PilX N-terminal domain-containing protein [Deltaproteobacteria bacterium]
MRLFGIIEDEKGTVMIISIVMLLILSIIGIYAMASSTIESKISGQKKFYDVAFNAADGGLDYVRAVNPFGTIDWTNDTWNFSNPEDTDIQFSGTVTYLGSTPPPVGSGCGVKGFRAHYYRVNSIGTDSGNIARSSVEEGGYRIGF